MRKNMFRHLQTAVEFRPVLSEWLEDPRRKRRCKKAWSGGGQSVRGFQAEKDLVKKD